MGKNASVFAFLSDTGLCVDHPFVYCSFSKQRGGYCICCVYICALGCLLYDTRRSFLGTDFGYNTKRKERTQFISNGRLGSTFGGILPALLIPILRQSSLGLRGGYLFGAILFGVMGALLSSLAFFTTKERIEPSTTTPTFKETVHVVGQNKLLLLVIAAAILGSTMVIANISADYIANYLIIQGYTDFDVLASTNDVVAAYKRRILDTARNYPHDFNCCHWCRYGAGHGRIPDASQEI